MARTYNRPHTSDPQADPTDLTLNENEQTILGFAYEQYQIQKTGKGFIPLRRRTLYRILLSNKQRIALTTIGDNLKRLKMRGLLVESKFTKGLYSITEEGEKAIDALRSGSLPTRSAYRGAASNLSQHSTMFRLHVKTKEFFHPSDLSKLGEVGTPVKMQGWDYYDVKIGEETIRILPNEVLLYVREVYDVNVESTQLTAINKAVEIATKLKTIGLICDGIELKKAHWARVGSLLADILVKHLGKYWYQLGDGTAFWIDFSGNTLEDETDNSKLRGRMDQMIASMQNTNSDWRDVDRVVTDIEGLKEVAHLTLAASQNQLRMQMGVSTPKPLPPSQKDVWSYFG